MSLPSNATGFTQDSAICCLRRTLGFGKATTCLIAEKTIWELETSTNENSEVFENALRAEFGPEYVHLYLPNPVVTYISGHAGGLKKTLVESAKGFVRHPRMGM